MGRRADILSGAILDRVSLMEKKAEVQPSKEEQAVLGTVLKGMEKQAQADNTAANEFMGRIFEARDYLHFAHLKVNGPGAYAAHMALNEAYEGLLDLADGFVEGWQGVHGLADLKTKAVSYNGDHEGYLQALYDYIDAHRDTFKESFLQNQIDEMQTLLGSTMYKLKNLK